MYIESAAGTAAGGKTGLTAITVGVLFLLILFLSPLSYLVPVYATAPALMYVGLLMLSNVAKSILLISSMRWRGWYGRIYCTDL